MAVRKKSVAFDEAVAREAAQRLQAIRVAELYAEYEARNGPVPETTRNDVAAEWEAASSGRE